MQQTGRLLIVLTVIALGGWGLFWLLPDTTETNTVTPANSPNAELTPTAPQPQAPVQQTNSVLIPGVITDQNARPLTGANVLYNAVSGVGGCAAAGNRPFELTENTTITNSGADGGFTLHIPRDVYHQGSACVFLSASKTGYYDSAITLLRLSEASADNQRIVEIELQAHRKLSGRVLEPGGEPVPSAQVLAWPSVYSHTAPAAIACERVETADQLSSRSGAAGDFQVSFAQRGNYCVRASHPQWASSAPVLINDDDDTAALSLTLQRPLYFSGQVQDSQGRPVPNLSLALKRAESYPAPSPTTQTDAAGHFSFQGIDWGTYALVTDSADYSVAAPEAPLVIEESVDDFLVKVFPLAYLRGRVLDERGEPLAGAVVSARSPFATESAWTREVTNADGEFKLPSLHQHQELRDMQELARAFSETDQQSNSFATVCMDVYHRDYRHKQLAIDGSDSIIELDAIYLQPATTQLEGRVRNREDKAVEALLTFHFVGAASGGKLDVIPGCDDVRFERVVNTDKDGRFSLHLETLGDYEVEVESPNHRKRRVSLRISNTDNQLDIQLD